MRRTRGDRRSAHRSVLPRASIGSGGRSPSAYRLAGLRVGSDRGGGRPNVYQGITNADMPSLSPQNPARPRRSSLRRLCCRRRRDDSGSRIGKASW